MFWKSQSETLLGKIEIEHISGSSLKCYIKFAFIVSLSRGLSKYIKSKVLTSCSCFV